MGVFHVFKIVQMVPNRTTHHITLILTTIILQDHYIKMRFVKGGHSTLVLRLLSYTEF